MFGHALLGAILAGVYCILHDEITYSISQIHYASYLGGFVGLIVAVAYVHRIKTPWQTLAKAVARC